MKTTLPKDIKTQIAELLEDDFRQMILIPIIDASGAYKVLDWHGRGERGKDVYFAYRNMFGELKHCCIFAKVGTITKSGRNDIRKMKEAMEEALFTEFDSPIDNSPQARIEEFYFATNGEVNDDARTYISDLFKANRFPNFKIYDIDWVVDVVRRLIRDFAPRVDKEYIFGCDTFSSFCGKVKIVNDGIKI